MAVDVVALLGRALASMIGWLQDIWRATGLRPVYMYAVLVVMACRYLLAPILGQAGSDIARNLKDREGD